MSKKRVNVINKKFLKKFGFKDYREFAVAFGNWAGSTTFVKQTDYSTSFGKLLKCFINDIKS